MNTNSDNHEMEHERREIAYDLHILSKSEQQFAAYLYSRHPLLQVLYKLDLL